MWTAEHFVRAAVRDLLRYLTAWLQLALVELWSRLAPLLGWRDMIDGGLAGLALRRAPG